MIPYLLLFTLWAGGAVHHHRSRHQHGDKLGFRIAIIATTLMVGLRWKVGGDWENYQRIFQEISLLDLRYAASFTDPAYGLLNFFCAKLGLGVVAANLFCASLFMGGVYAFARKQPNPWLTVAVAVPYFIIVVGMGYTRQASAIGLTLVGLSIAERRGLLAAACCVALGGLFHKSAVLILPLLSFSQARRNALLFVLGLIGFVLLYAWVLRGSAENLINNYVNSDYHSSGAAIRIAMNALAGTIFLVLGRKMRFSQFEYSFWFSCALLTYVCIVGLVSASSSVGIDRLALFLIPLQLAVYGRLPYVSSIARRSDAAALSGVIVYSAAVLAIFLLFGTNSYGWLPYRFAPLEASR